MFNYAILALNLGNILLIIKTFPLLLTILLSLCLFFRDLKDLTTFMKNNIIFLDYNYLMFKNRTFTRMFFVQYLYSNYFNNINEINEKGIENILNGDLDYEDLLSSITTEDESFQIDEKFLKFLYKSTKSNIKIVLEFIQKHNKRENNVDIIIKVLLIAAVNEMIFHHSSIVISEYLKISDFLETNSVFINGVLDSIAKDPIFPKKDSQESKESNINS